VRFLASDFSSGSFQAFGQVGFVLRFIIGRNPTLAFGTSRMVAKPIRCLLYVSQRSFLFMIVVTLAGLIGSNFRRFVISGISLATSRDQTGFRK
jgi:hypothetical protein